MSLFMICGIIQNIYQLYEKHTQDTQYFHIIFTQFEVLIKLVNGYILSQGTYIVIIGIRHDIREETNTHREVQEQGLGVHMNITFL